MTSASTFLESDPLLNKVKKRVHQDAVILLNDEAHLPKKREYPHETYGYFLLLCAAISNTGMGVIVRYATAFHSFPVSSVAVFLGLLQSATALVSIFFFTDYKQVLSMSSRLFTRVALRGFLGATAMYLVFLALSLIPLGIQTSFFFLNPIFTIVLSAQILGEEFGLFEIAAAFVSLIGVILVSNPKLEFDFSQIHNSNYAVGCIVAFMSGLVVAFAYVTLKSVGSKLHFMISVLSLGLWSIVFGILMGGASIEGMREHGTGTWFALVGCMFGVLSQCFLNKGFQYCRAGTGTMMQNVDVPISYLLGLVFLNEVPHFESLIGSTLVIVGTVLVSAKQFLVRK